MVLKDFRQKLDPVRETLGKIDAVLNEAGEHVNEAQAEKLLDLLRDLNDKTGAATAEADETLKEIETEQESEGAFESDEVDDSESRDAQDGDVFVMRNGRPMRVPKGIIIVGADDGAKIVGQGNQIGGDPNAHPVMAQAIKSLEAALERSRSKKKGPAVGISTNETGEREKKDDGGDVVELANTKGDVAEHHTDDGSRQIETAEGSEGAKILTTDTAAQKSKQDPGTNDKPDAIRAAQGDAGAAHQFTQSITADQPADAAAVMAGEQEMVRKQTDPAGETRATLGDLREDPAPSSELKEHPDPMQKTSGKEGDAGDWTKQGRTKDGFPVDKGSPEDVTLGYSVELTAPKGDIHQGDAVTITGTATNLDPKQDADYVWAISKGQISGTSNVACVNTDKLTPGTYTVQGYVAQGNTADRMADASCTFTVVE